MPNQPIVPLHAEPLVGDAAIREAAALYTRVFRYEHDEFSLNPNLVSALARNGGSAIGVRDEGRLVGFAYGFAGRDRSAAEFHYSQAAVVDPEYQGRGVGRLLKAGQRQVALGWGQQRMRWTFDPLLARNAHFNFATLQAEGTGYAVDYYDRPGTDRIVVDWALDRDGDPFAGIRSLPSPAFDAAEWGRVFSATENDRRIARLPLPAVTDGPAATGSTLRAHIREGMQEIFEAGLVLVNCTRIDDETAVYLAGEDVR
ncbi:GNAT family N-acetyltransferase [Microbacterium murale]|uniref:GNAT superfamily acetyltransferase n=1 Tax=Microbacterium murale TaxID=1081040 RepID=A0ABU0PB09_9MICO|nr:GNAT family N-acetyltransferase [Microbacterium murale]MDQ0644127.1 putative GNAT superfamily acetyltransferase [Microbacterium murale]